MTAAEGHGHRAWHLCTPCAGKLRQGIALYRGDFLAHFYLSDSAPFEEWAHYWLGNILRDGGDWAEAQDHYRLSLEICLERQDRVGAASILEDFAVLLNRQGQWLRVARMLGAAAAFREAAQVRLTSYGEEERGNKVLTSCRSALGDAAFEKAWATGRAMKLAEVVALAVD